MHFHQRTRATRKWLAVLTLAAVSLLIPISAASAHDSLVGTSPADGETVDAVPEAIELTFTNPPIELGSEISVVSEDGTNWSDGPVEIVGDVATQPIKAGAPAGEYTVTWRVVSSDSHPIEGVYSFTADGSGEGDPSAGDPSTGDASTADPSAGASSTDAPAEVGPANPLTSPTSDAEQAQDAEEAATVFPTSFVAIMIGVLIVLVIIIAVLARRRLGRTIEPDGP